MMFVGGCAGSTADGIKVIRVLISFRTIGQDIVRMVHPRAVTPLKIGGRVVPEGVRLAALGLFAAWVAIFGAATFLAGSLAREPYANLFRDRGCCHAERRRAGVGTGRCHRKFRDR